MEIQEIAGIQYTLPTVVILQDSPLLVGELAGRTAYDSFDKSEHEVIRNFSAERISELDADSSEILSSLAWVYHHHSVLEHLSLSYLINGTSRGVLQEIVRHRIASYTVRSTRYTMSNVINAFIAELAENYFNTEPSEWFIETIQSLDLFVTSDNSYNKLQIIDIFKKLKHQYEAIGIEAFMKLAVAKSSMYLIESGLNSKYLFIALQDGKSKRNVGDSFKHIVNDNWKVDLVVTFNLRSLKNYLELRDSGAAYFQIQWLAQAMKATTPSKYLDLIVKSK